jgi:hypothetical protein
MVVNHLPCWLQIIFAPGTAAIIICGPGRGLHLSIKCAGLPQTGILCHMYNFITQTLFSFS